MRLQIFSDAHIDYPGARGLPPLIPGARAVIIAGDTCEGLTGALGALRRKYLPPTEVVVVSGNHEFFSGTTWSEDLSAGRLAALKLGIHFLENDTITIDRLRVIGATLWTDYELFGTALCESAMQTAQRTMIDHSEAAIKTFSSEGGAGPTFRI